MGKGKTSGCLRWRMTIIQRSYHGRVSRRTILSAYLLDLVHCDVFCGLHFPSFLVSVVIQAQNGPFLPLLRVLMDNFSPAQYDRFEAYRRHALPKQAVRKVRLLSACFSCSPCHILPCLVLSSIQCSCSSPYLPVCLLFFLPYFCDSFSFCSITRQFPDALIYR